MDGVDPVQGRRFGSYVVEQKLGEGGMGAVYRAIQPEIGKQVAIKFLAPALAQNPQVVQRFFAEAKSVNLIQHDNIVDIFDFGQSDGQSWFVMELLKGASLESSLTDEKRFSIGRAVDVGIQVADAISAAHARSIIHRDLKPDNIFLVTKSGRRDFVKLLDFGIAKLTGAAESSGLSRTMAGAVLGTPGYMSPEQGTGGEVDARTDLYALGVILFRMISGRLPFDGETFPQILQKQLIEPPPQLRALRPDVPLPLAQLVHQMIARELGERPATMAEVLDRLMPLQPADYGREASGLLRLSPERSSGPISILPVSSTTLSGSAGQQSSGRHELGDPRRKLWLGGGAALIVAVLGGVLFGLGGKKPPPPIAIAPAAVPPIAPAIPAPQPPAATAPTPSGFLVLVETDPAGAEIWQGTNQLGLSPRKIQLPGEVAQLRLHLAGYRDRQLDVGAHTEHTFVRLRPLPRAAHPAGGAAPAAHLPSPPPSAVPPRSASKKPAIGLDD